MADTVPGTWDTSINKTMFSVLVELTLLGENIKKINTTANYIILEGDKSMEKSKVEELRGTRRARMKVSLLK